jgi:hypothetical protein
MEDHRARARQSKVAAAMRPGVVVVLDVGKNADEVPFAADQEPVQALGACTRHLSLGVRVRRCDRDPDDLAAVGGEHGVEARDETWCPGRG